VQSRLMKAGAVALKRRACSRVEGASRQRFRKRCKKRLAKSVQAAKKPVRTNIVLNGLLNSGLLNSGLLNSHLTMIVVRSR